MRELTVGVSVSLLLHAVLLSYKPVEVRNAPMTPAIVARLAEPQIETVPAPAPAPRKVPRKASPAPELPEATTEGQYRYLLAAAAARHNGYPAEARGAEGDAVVRIGVGASGSIHEVTLARSAGHPALDEQALQVFRRAAREVPVPRALWGRDFGVELSASYRAEAVR